VSSLPATLRHENAASVAAHFTPEGSLTIYQGASAAGRTAITISAQSFTTTFPDLQLFMDDILIKRDRAEYHWTLIGSNNGLGDARGPHPRRRGIADWPRRADRRLTRPLLRCFSPVSASAWARVITLILLIGFRDLSKGYQRGYLLISADCVFDASLVPEPCLEFLSFAN
jgi:hypothetical protein